MKQGIATLRSGPDRQIVVAFDAVNYGDLMQFLHRLMAQNGAHVGEATFNRLDGRPGMVEARLLLVSEKTP